MLTRVNFALRTVSLVVMVPLVLLSVALGCAVHALVWLVDEIIGKGAWWRGRRHHIESERPLLSDAESLRSQGIGADGAPLWLAIRTALADSVGLPCEAIYPEDRIMDLWRIQWGGLDLLDIVFRLERSLGVRITRESVERLWNVVRLVPLGEFGQFAAAMVGVIREAQKTAAVQRANPASAALPGR
jgi:hypothetical protein